MIPVTVALPDNVRQIIDILARRGYDGYAVGGCVRDSLLGKTPHDWDICTPATPEEMKACFTGLRVIETGVRHGTLTVMLDGTPYEVTTYRVDGDYRDHRHPESVTFVRSLIDDLSRRDFTINAMAYNDKEGLVDPFGGWEDLSAGLIRCVGNPDERFDEDALRILRALRFASVFGFRIEPDTAASLRRQKQLLCHISAERINTELSKLLCGDGAGEILKNYPDIIAVFIPEITPMPGFEQHNPYHRYDVWEHTAVSVQNAPRELVLRLVMLLHDIAKPRCFTRDANGAGHFYGHQAIGAKLAQRILRRLKYDNRTVDTVTMLVRCHDVAIQPDARAVKRLLGKLGPDNFKRLLAVKRADFSAKSADHCARNIEKLDAIQGILQRILEEGQCFRVKDLAVNGSDLLALGFSQDKKLGRALETLLELVISEQVPNDRAQLLKIAETLKDA